MPNIKQIISLKEQYGSLNDAESKAKVFLENSSTHDLIEKGFREDLFEKDANFSFLLEHLNVRKPSLIRYFETSPEEDVALLFIDISSFSKRIVGWPNQEIKDYLDKYYSKIIPIIYKHGGEIEKLMGDGVICVFGKPFLNLENPYYVYKAERCAEEIVKKFHDTEKEVKIAIHKGIVTYYKVPGELYGEYTMIGQPLTDLFRLESVSRTNAINFYKGSSYDKLGWALSAFNENVIVSRQHEIPSLQGVRYKNIQTIKFPGYA